MFYSWYSGVGRYFRNPLFWLLTSYWLPGRRPSWSRVQTGRAGCCCLSSAGRSRCWPWAAAAEWRSAAWLEDKQPQAERRGASAAAVKRLYQRRGRKVTKYKTDQTDLYKLITLYPDLHFSNIKLLFGCFDIILEDLSSPLTWFGHIISRRIRHSDKFLVIIKMWNCKVREDQKCSLSLVLQLTIILSWLFWWLID